MLTSIEGHSIVVDSLVSLLVGSGSIVGVRGVVGETPAPPSGGPVTAAVGTGHLIDVKAPSDGVIAHLRDAQPLVRIPPQYPERCQTRAGSKETVFLQFDVTPDGTTTNIQVIDSTNSCFNSAASRSVERWKYQPKIVDNEPQWRRGVQTQITFELTE